MYESRFLKKLVVLALDEDLGYGDITSRVLANDDPVQTYILAREDLVVCGVHMAKLVFGEMGVGVEIDVLVEDGVEVKDGTRLLNIKGPGRSVLMAERTILNFMQRLSGIATHVRAIMKKNPEVAVLDTRKTTPGWRVPEKYAVVTGGARNHRMSLGEMVMVKNNHLDRSETELDAYFQKINSTKPFYAPVQVEVRSLAELKLIAKYEPESVLLDNMSREQIGECTYFLATFEWKPSIEVSGRVEPEDLAGLSDLGVHTVSTSYLMHGSRPADLSLRVETDDSSS